MASKLFSARDMTEGAPWKGILWFTVPMLIGNVAQQLYSTVDSIVVGRYVGDNALAAVGSATPILNLLLVLFIGISAGVNIMVSQYFGAKNRSRRPSGLRRQACNTTPWLTERHGYDPTFLNLLLVLFIGISAGVHIRHGRNSSA